MKVGQNIGANKLQITLDQEGYVCPSVVNKDNFLSNLPYGAVFSVSVLGRVMTVEKADGKFWGFDLRFRCCKESRPIYTEGKIPIKLKYVLSDVHFQELITSTQAYKIITASRKSINTIIVFSSDILSNKHLVDFQLRFVSLLL